MTTTRLSSRVWWASGGGGLTPLVFAAREGDLESAKLLLDAGAPIDQVTEYGWTPLLTAVNNRNYQLAKFLLEKGADPNIANKGGWTPLYLATDKPQHRRAATIRFPSRTWITSTSSR
jgi:ankyrin repeat protein